MIEKIKKRKDNNFSISYAEQHHRKKGKDKNKRKQKNSFKDIEFLENNTYEIGNYPNNGYDMIELHERLLKGEEIKLFDLETTRKVIRNKEIKNKVGSYKFDNGYILDIISFIDNKNVFLIRKG